MSRQHTLLVVDDEPNVVQTVKDLLRRECQVFGATGAAEGMRVLREQRVDVVMSDQRMPDTNGVEFLSQVRVEYPDAIRLLVTGYADIRAVIDAINQGHIYRYIAKPWDPDELQLIIRQAGEMHDLLLERKRLLAELRERNEQLQVAHDELLKSSELKDAFIRVASHELRTPLTVLLGLSALAGQMPEMGPLAKDWFGRIQESSLRLHRLVEQMLQMLRAGRYERSLLRQPTDLGELVRAAADDVRPFVEKRRQELTLEVDQLGTMGVDGGKIRDCLDNLLLNAIKFTPDGGHIEVRARRLVDGGATIQIRDNGIGIDPAHLPHVFDPFFTEFDVSRHSSGQFEFGRRGLGLGLSVVKAFVQLHGGTVAVASAPGKGSTFTLQLPADQT